MKQGMVILIVGVLLTVFIAPSYAADSEYAEQAKEKFMRGLINMVSAAAEIGKGMQEEMETGAQPVFGAIGGFINGTIKGLGRFASGLYDVIITPVPNAEPWLLDPPTLFEAEEK